MGSWFLKKGKEHIHFQSRASPEVGYTEWISPISVPQDGCVSYSPGRHFQHLKDNKVTGNTNTDLLKGKSYLTNVIAFCDKMMGSQLWGRAMAATYLNLSKAFTWSQQWDRQSSKIWFGEGYDNVSIKLPGGLGSKGSNKHYKVQLQLATTAFLQEWN